jgi:hypothetical protein
MIKFLIKLALTVLIAHATWRIGTAYVSHYRFKDGVQGAALTPRVNDVQLRARVMELASENDVPLEDENLAIRRDTAHIYVDASYVRAVEVLPGYPYPWQFSWSLDVYVLSGSVAPERAPANRPSH